MALTRLEMWAEIKVLQVARVISQKKKKKYIYKKKDPLPKRFQKRHLGKLSNNPSKTSFLFLLFPLLLLVPPSSKLKTPRSPLFLPLPLSLESISYQDLWLFTYMFTHLIIYSSIIEKIFLLKSTSSHYKF